MRGQAPPTARGASVRRPRVRRTQRQMPLRGTPGRLGPASEFPHQAGQETGPGARESREVEAATAQRAGRRGGGLSPERKLGLGETCSGRIHVQRGPCRVGTSGPETT